jgi:membrane protease YdiL (CAAX protease family)
MTIIRNDPGEIRLVWRLILILLLFVAVAVLLRFIPIILYTKFLVSGGMAQGNALEKANTIILEDPVWSTLIGTLNGLMGFLIAWLLVKVIERSTFTWKVVGLDWRRNSLLLIILGALLAVFLFIAYIFVGYPLGSYDFSLNTLLMGVGIASFFQKFILFIVMGFGEEVVFRGYVQTRLTARLGVIWGVIVTAVVFTLLHQVSYRLSPVTIVSGTMLWVTLGALYHLSKSLYLVGMFHGVMNTLMSIFNFEVSEISGMVVHALALFIVVIIACFYTKISNIPKSPV